MSSLIHPRHEWGHSADLGSEMHLPAVEAWIHHSVSALTEDPIEDMLSIEDTGVQRFGIFSYSYCYHAITRTWWEGAGTTVGAHTGGRNSKSLGLCVIGNTNELELPHFTVDCAALIDELLATGKLRKGRQYPSGGHRDLKPTACPGDNAYDMILAIRETVGNATTPPKGWLDMLSPDEQRQLFDETHQNNLMLKQLQNIILGDNERLGDTQVRQLASLKRVEIELGLTGDEVEIIAEDVEDIKETLDG